jgi:hypothetical protein
MGVNHLADLARIPFRSSIDEYIESFQTRLAHAGYLTPEQQTHLFTGGLPDHICIDVELQAPQELQRAMALARAYERRATTTTLAGHHRTPRPQPRPLPPPGPTNQRAGRAPDTRHDDAVGAAAGVPPAHTNRDG